MTVGALSVGAVDALDSTPNCALASCRACRVLSSSDPDLALLALSFRRVVACVLSARLDF